MALVVALLITRAALVVPQNEGGRLMHTIEWAIRGALPKTVRKRWQMPGAPTASARASPLC